MEEDTFVAWMTENTGAGLAVSIPFDGNHATVGNGVMVAIQVASTAEVDRVYSKAFELGATDEGPAGPRGDDGFYAGYFRDLDGNKLNVFTMG